MGMTKVKLIVKNPRKLSQQLEADFLVDNGAHYTVLPAHMVKKLNLKPAYTQEFVLVVSCSTHSNESFIKVN